MDFDAREWWESVVDDLRAVYVIGAGVALVGWHLLRAGGKAIRWIVVGR